MRRRIYLLLILLSMLNLSAQNDHISTYNSINLNYTINKKFSIYAEGQQRSNADFSYADHYEIKGGLAYKLPNNHKIMFVFGRYMNYKDHAIDKEEYRIWLQDAYKLSAGKFEFENRVKLEKSWFYSPPKDEHSGRMRFLYRLNISVPLNSAEVKPGTISANVYDEVYFLLTDQPFFSRNRVFGGFSYQADQIFSLSAGYLWQRDLALSGNKNLHYLYLALGIKLDGSKSRKIKTASAD